MQVSGLFADDTDERLYEGSTCFLHSDGWPCLSENDERKYNRFIIRLRYLATLYRKHRQGEERQREMSQLELS